MADAEEPHKMIYASLDCRSNANRAFLLSLRILCVVLFGDFPTDRSEPYFVFAFFFLFLVDFVFLDCAVHAVDASVLIEDAHAVTMKITPHRIRNAYTTVSQTMGRDPLGWIPRG